MSKSSKRRRPTTSRGTPSPSALSTASHAAVVESEGAPRGTSLALSRLEIALVVMILVGGVVLRFAFPERLGVEHFDEGVYASNLWFDANSGDHYPVQHLYAPSLVPALIESSLLAEQVMASPTRPSGLAAMVPSLLAGCATLLIIWWVMRTWFDPPAALGAMLLAASSEFHAVYSRAALTDVMLLPWMLLAVYFFERALSRRQWRLLGWAGLACGLAWWTKYNGWLPLLIALGGILLRPVFVSSGWRSVGRDLGYWAGFALVSALVWSPFLWSLQATGGYAPVMANHRGYVVGWEGWPGSFMHQLANLQHFDGWLSCLAPTAAVVLGVLFSCLDAPEHSRRRRRLRFDLLLVTVFSATSLALAIWCGVAAVLSYLSVSGLLAYGSRLRRAEGHAAKDHLALWLVAAWFAGLFLMTPLYSPYPRLTLTWLCASWLAGGLGIAVVVQGCVPDRRASGQAASGRMQALLRHQRTRFALSAVILIAVKFSFDARQEISARGVSCWQDRAALGRVAESIETRLAGQNALVFVQGEPGLFYQLRAAGVIAVPSFNFSLPSSALPADVTAYLATGLHAECSEEFQRLLDRNAARLEEPTSIPYQPSDLVLLNNFRPAQLTAQQQVPWRVRLYKLR